LSVSLIIVEGPDCARKSTLVDALARALRSRVPRPHVRVLHAGPPRAHPLDEYVLPLLSYQTNHAEQHVICDRWHLGELVYPRVLGRPTQLDDPVFRYVELFLQARGAQLVVVTPEVSELRDCLARRGDDLVDDSTIEATREGFVEVATRTRLPLIWLKDETVMLELVWGIIGEAEDAAADVARLAQFVTYVGPARPRLLLLGDVRATGATPGDLRPAFMPYGATSGHYLMRALGDADGVGLANACDVDDAFELTRRLGPERVALLGRNAQRTLQWGDDRAMHAPHPQWQRRFRHHQLDEYRATLLGEYA
jgi:thymidylate kinase